MQEGKERKEEHNQNFSQSIFSTVRRINGTLGYIVCHNSLGFFICKSFRSLYCGYVGAAPIPYVLDAILNLPNSYLRSTTVLLDKIHV